MKTVISKENAIAILEELVVQQTLALRIMDLTDVVNEFFVHSDSIAKALFNIDLTHASTEEYEEVSAIICDVVETANLSNKEKAERIYTKFDLISRIDNLKAI